MRLLLVEDDAMIGEAVQRGLRALAFTVDWVRDGETALIAARETDYDLLVLDLGLPGRDGLEVLRELRRAWAKPFRYSSSRHEARCPIACLASTPALTTIL